MTTDELLRDLEAAVARLSEGYDEVRDDCRVLHARVLALRAGRPVAEVVPAPPPGDAQHEPFSGEVVTKIERMGADIEGLRASVEELSSFAVQVRREVTAQGQEIRHLSSIYTAVLALLRDKTEQRS